MVSIRVKRQMAAVGKVVSGNLTFFAHLFTYAAQ